MRYLSGEWIEALDAAARNHDGLRAAARGADLVLQQTITDGERVTYRIELRDGEVRVRSGPIEAPTVSLSTDRATAASIARGEASAQVAFMNGDLRLGGNMSALLDHHELLAGLDDVFAQVRDRTDWHA